MADITTLLDARYGSNTSTSGDSISEAANLTIKTLLEHKSARHFLPSPLVPVTLEILVAAAQSAATSSNLQTWSVVAVSDPERKDALATLSGDQDFIRQAPLFLIFCADLNRLTRVSQQHQQPAEGLEYIEMFLMASLDAALAAQNAAVAAESLGLGICYVGAVRNRAAELASLLHLPSRVVALFGMAVGKPDLTAGEEVKPRLPLDEVLHREVWDDNAGAQAEHVQAYDQTLDKFNNSQGREGVALWSQRSAQRVSTLERLSGRHVLRDVLRGRDFNLK
ncbi:Uu.00g008270.m01.CDS01 [Anthostomella pinea]|uniref:Uu.00g008270.m01.CDS01 n=1 Tax=Anthostomella pinea TaxID=933095 RepID=A0AAI8YPU6_9PEZI|nr:Uu.00g008270.m01.CDS01 [Anthostomella pinea]